MSAAAFSLVMRREEKERDSKRVVSEPEERKANTLWPPLRWQCTKKKKQIERKKENKFDEPSRKANYYISMLASITTF